MGNLNRSECFQEYARRLDFHENVFGSKRLMIEYFFGLLSYCQKIFWSHATLQI